MMTWPARSPKPQTIRPAYFVQSQPNADVSGLSPFGSPLNPQGQVSYYHHDSVAKSSSTPRSSGPLRNGYSSLQVHDHNRSFDEDDDHEDYHEMDVQMRGGEGKRGFTRACSLRLCSPSLSSVSFCGVGISKSFSPIVTVKAMELESLNVQSGSAHRYAIPKFNGQDLIRKPCNILHCPRHLLSPSSSAIPGSSSPLVGCKNSRESIIETKVLSNQIPLYGGVPAFYVQRAKPDRVVHAAS